jgi:hypothetical protein
VPKAACIFKLKLVSCCEYFGRGFMLVSRHCNLKRVTHLAHMRYFVTLTIEGLCYNLTLEASHKILLYITNYTKEFRETPLVSNSCYPHHISGHCTDFIIWWRSSDPGSCECFSVPNHNRFIDCVSTSFLLCMLVLYTKFLSHAKDGLILHSISPYMIYVENGIIIIIST